MKKILARLLICLLAFPALPSYFTTVKLWDGIDNVGVNSDGSLNVTTTTADTVTARVSLRDTLHVIVTDHQGNMADVDSTTGCLATIDIEHHEIHEGEHFVATDTAIGVGASASKLWLLKTGSTKFVHFTYSAASSLNGTLFFWGSTDTGASGAKGTAIQRYNNNRNRSTDTATTMIYRNPTISGAGATYGNMMYAEVIGTDGTSPTGRSGGVSFRANEFILKKNTFYLIQFLSLTAANRMSFTAQFYEE